MTTQVSLSDSVCNKLQISSAELNSLFVVEPTINHLGGDPAPSGRAVETALRERFGLDDSDLFDALENAQILTAEETAWLRDG